MAAADSGAPDVSAFSCLDDPASAGLPPSVADEPTDTLAMPQGDTIELEDGEGQCCVCGKTFEDFVESNRGLSEISFMIPPRISEVVAPCNPSAVLWVLFRGISCST